LRKTCGIFTDVVAYLLKWVNFSDVKHIECLGLLREVEYEETRKAAAVLRFELKAIMFEPYEEFTAVQPYVNNLMKMASITDMCVGEVKVFLTRNCHRPI
jgi:hypothetical protein